VNLNFQFAKQQVAQNDLLGAASTLERILLVNPDLYQVRLFYAVVLYRLDNVTEAERELDGLAAIKLPASVQAEVQDFKKKLQKQKRRTHLACVKVWDLVSTRTAMRLLPPKSSLQAMSWWIWRLPAARRMILIS